MAGRRNKKVKDVRKNELKMKEGEKGRRNLGGKEKKREKSKKKKYSASFKQVRLVLLVFLSVEKEGVVGRIDFSFLPS